MFHNTYDRFQGSWWGAIVAQGLIGKSITSPDLHRQSWLVQRRQLATILLNLEAPDLSPVSHDDIHLLSILPLIIFSTAPLRFYLDKIFPHTSDSKLNQIKMRQDLLGWEYLLNQVLKHKFMPLAQNHLGDEVNEHIQDIENWLAEQLELVSELIKAGASLNLAIEKLSVAETSTSTAIALAWYCFATTPQNFNLSVRKAAHVSKNFAWLTIALTGTLSGAYNGMAEISRFWRANENSHDQQLEHHLCKKLFAEWSGIYGDSQQFLNLNPNLAAVALPRIIQPRLNLKIISQISDI
ncbi:MAG: hypothetical protein AAFO95_08645 [Cyanobacteria bacterium J06600_6]